MQNQAQAKREIFNPFTALASSPEDRDASLSALINSDIGVCPKCKNPMGRATIANNDTVFYCPKDRVALPLPNPIGC